MDDLRAVMDAVGSERAVLFGYSEGGPMSILFAATYPERVDALVLYGTYARRMSARRLPLGRDRGGAPAHTPTGSNAEWALEADMRQSARTRTRRWRAGGGSVPAQRRVPARRAT